MYFQAVSFSDSRPLFLSPITTQFRFFVLQR
nr:MAG TPA: hypothetical protein [Bacteriophage sp.]